VPNGVQNLRVLGIIYKVVGLISIILTWKWDESAAAEVRAMYNGKLKFPTLVIGEKRFKDPSIADIKPFVDELDK